MGRRYSRNKQTSVLILPRGGKLRVLPESAAQYAGLMSLISQHARGEYIYAAPDCPELYFLSARRNPTRALFEFLENPPFPTRSIMDAIHQHQITLVVINQNPSFSGPLPDELRAELNEEFPKSQSTLSFEVRWKP